MRPESLSVDTILPPEHAMTWRMLWTTLAITVALVVAWEAYARSFTGLNTGARISGRVVQDASNNDDLARTFQAIPSPAERRLLILGSSQIHSVQGEAPFSPLAFPFRMAALDSVTPGLQVLDLSGPGQQVLESMAIQLGSRPPLRPSAVVLGIGLFSMLSTDVRPALRSALDGTAIRQALDAARVRGLADSSHALLLQRLTVPETRPAIDSTIQQRTDARLERRLEHRVAFAANRRAMHFALVDQPLRRDLIQFIQRRRGAITTARTYEIGTAYTSSLAAIEAMGAAAAREAVPFVVVLLPFERSRTPSPYSPETAARIAADVQALAARSGFVVLDLSSSLGPDDFGHYADGSPDGLHFGPRGHDLVGQRVAAALAPLLDAARR